MSDQGAKDATDRGYEQGIVTFLDVLGFRELLGRLHSDEILALLTRLRTISRGDGEDEEPPRGFDEVRLRSQAFSESVSDAVVRVRTIETQAEDGALGLELLDLAHIQAACIRRDILLRGGLAIGPIHVGLDGRGPVFGDAMVRAYGIEQSEAVYPRIAIDDAAVEALLADPSFWQLHQFDEEDAETFARFIGTGEDGTYFLDYLAVMDEGEFDHGERGRFEFLAMHRALIERRLAGEADAKVRRKLEWLANYHDRFVSELRRSYDEDDPDGSFLDEIGTPPKRLFDSLMVGGRTGDLRTRLDDLAADPDRAGPHAGWEEP